MRYVGRVTDWNDAKGFGFVVPNGGGDRAFVHVKAFERHGRRPVDGDLISYVLQSDARGRRNATAIRYAQTRVAPAPVPHRRLPRRVLAGVAFAALLGGWLLHKLPFAVVLVYAILSGIAMVLYAFDKSAATHGRQRTPESTLHAVALFGGWPGALLAQALFRHKSRKAEFQLLFWITVAVNCGALAWAWRAGVLRG